MYIFIDEMHFFILNMDFFLYLSVNKMLKRSVIINRLASKQLFSTIFAYAVFRNFRSRTH